MDTLAQYIQTLTPQLSAWRRDFHHFAESGWVEFRTAAKVAEILDSLGYELAMGRDVVDLCVKEFSQDKWIYFPWDIDYKFVPPIKKNV